MKKYLRAFLREKPFFFSIVRSKEAQLYQEFKPFKKTILDLGCGDGFFAHVAFGRVDAGIDPDERALKEARARRIYKEVKSYDGRKIPYPRSYFSTILCNSTFEHILNIDEVLKEVARIIKKGGMLCFTVPTDSWSNYLFGNKIMGKSYESYFINKSKHWNLYSFKKWKGILKKLSFEATYHAHYLDSKKAMWLFDISHYLSISSLATKKLFNKWVLFPDKEKLLGGIEKLIIDKTKQNTKKGPYLFIAAIKK